MSRVSREQGQRGNAGRSTVKGGIRKSYEGRRVQIRLHDGGSNFIRLDEALSTKVLYLDRADAQRTKQPKASDSR